MENPYNSLTALIRGSRMLRLVFVGVLVLLLLIPIASLGRLVSERQGRAAGAVDEVSSKWGKRQAIVGPALVLPVIRTRTLLSPSGEQVTAEEPGSAVFLPRSLRTTGSIDSQVRRRGIFSVPVYRLDLRLDGDFAKPDFSQLGIDPATVEWDRAHLVVAISDVRAIQEQTAVDWNGQSSVFVPGSGSFAEYPTGIHAPVAAGPAAEGYRFSFPLTLNGSMGVSMAPFAETTEVQLKSNSTNPSFQGNWLPSTRVVGKQGFEAGWSISFLGRNFPQAWTDRAEMRPAIEGSQFGVDLVEPVDAYSMAKRSLKYAGLFILLTFALVWLIEILGRVRVHPIQYLLLGSALCLFYLLELSLAEHLGFGPAYGIASLAVVAMVAGYSWVIFRQRSRAAAFAGAVAGLYGYLFVLLRNEDYALLLGSIGLFTILGGIMYATRRVDWSAPAPQPGPG